MVFWPLFPTVHGIVCVWWLWESAMTGFVALPLLWTLCGQFHSSHFPFHRFWGPSVSVRFLTRTSWGLLSHWLGVCFSTTSVAKFCQTVSLPIYWVAVGLIATFRAILVCSLFETGGLACPHVTSSPPSKYLQWELCFSLSSQGVLYGFSVSLASIFPVKLFVRGDSPWVASLSTLLPSPSGLWSAFPQILTKSNPGLFHSFSRTRLSLRIFLWFPRIRVTQREKVFTHYEWLGYNHSFFYIGSINIFFLIIVIWTVIWGTH